ncbi:hypothetical protein [Actinopolyspora mortivallis]|uniref:hypothetical protein n=1 Tax=Actinopolyspora mortivallis TaxID=33906 RepID=UPI0003684D26|nr:hypothetical protein [Actinopolyspora mortivallis]
MDGSLDVRKFLALQDRGYPRSSTSVPAQRGDSARFSSEQLHRARIAVARCSKDREDCTRLLEMLGLNSDEDADGEHPVTD